MSYMSNLFCDFQTSVLYFCQIFLKETQMETFITHHTIPHQPQSIAQFSNASLVVVLLLKLR